MRAGFIGAGRIGQVLSKAIFRAGLIRPENIIASDVFDGTLNKIAENGIKTTKKNREVVEKSDLICIAVKPNVVVPVLKEIAPFVTERHLFMSIAAGVTIETMEKILPKKSRVIRVMPNTPSLVKAGASVYSRGSHVIEGDAAMVAELFSSVGLCMESPEYLLDTVTGLSGSGPSYIFVAIQALADGGVKMGLPRDISLKLAAQTAMGAAKMVLDTGKHPEELKDAVCSPAGTSIAAIHSLEKNGFRGALIDAVEAATKRSAELGKINGNGAGNN
ncbi:pyrroline-5-carboxylate reductase 2-like isoform X2 [Lineus longissimus]|uniref:pyrroline-5-carboxylate reductase 2-like isoform X2 n=1 Tax=Lineus longissimus TaxID=88925 RepID=UPI002B4EC23C